MRLDHLFPELRNVLVFHHQGRLIGDRDGEDLHLFLGEPLTRNRQREGKRWRYPTSNARYTVPVAAQIAQHTAIATGRLDGGGEERHGVLTKTAAGLAIGTVDLFNDFEGRGNRSIQDGIHPRAEDIMIACPLAKETFFKDMGMVLGQQRLSSGLIRAVRRRVIFLRRGVHHLSGAVAIQGG